MANGYTAAPISDGHIVSGLAPDSHMTDERMVAGFGFFVMYSLWTHVRSIWLLSHI